MAKERTNGRSIMKRRPQRARRTSLRRPNRVWTQRVLDLWSEPAFSWGVLIFLAFFLIGGGVAAWVREQPLIAPGRVMERTRVVRETFTVTSEERTRAREENARQQTPRVYREIAGVIDGVVADVRSLPAIVAASENVETMDTDVRAAFRLDQQRFEALRSIATDDAARTAWAQATDTLADVLSRNPMLERAEWQRVSEGLDRRIELIRGEQSVMAPRDQAINIGDADAIASRVPRLVTSSGFGGAGAEAVSARLSVSPEATYLRDDNLTATREKDAAEAIQAVVETRAQGQIIFTRGDKLTDRQNEIYRDELRNYAASLKPWQLWLSRGSATIGVVAVGLVLAGYLSLFATRIAGRPSRMAWIVGLMLAGQALAAILTVLDPAFIAFTVSVPVLLVGILVAIAYDQKSALAVGSLSAGLVSLSLGLSMGQLMAVIAGLAAAIWFLRELRDRRSLVGVSVAAGLTLAAAWSTIGLLGLPMTVDTVRQAIGDGIKAGFGGLIAGGVTLFVLPLVERAFDITTGMTLIELRDPKQPLLRDLQRRAPGTYNHALNVASIAESAADAIGADGLLTYVGALYHDVGKMNKPEYFVENQSGGINKHDRLSPAMSLLVIIGHVKDGLEIAAEYNLPRVLRHFIEGHHGTTLVEFFYRRAVEQAASTDTDGDGETEDERLPDEVDFRYPGPKPRTKECAILMLADAVESATRAMAEPTPSRIESLVRQLADKRLIDGQFDECDLTLRELHVIVESISKTVTSIYHGRIKYPGSAPARKPAKQAEKTA